MTAIYIATLVLLVAVFYFFLPAVVRGDLARALAGAMHNIRVALRYTELGGYVHDTAMSQFIPPNAAMFSAGTWTNTETGVADIWSQRRTAADATANVWIPIKVPSNSVAQKGAYLKSIDVWFVVGTAALDSLAATIFKVTLPADGAAAAAGSSQTFTYDTGHDAAAERIDVDEHKMTLTITTPFWVDDDEYVFVELAIDAAATSVFDLLGARANFTLRI